MKRLALLAATLLLGASMPSQAKTATEQEKQMPVGTTWMNPASADVDPTKAVFVSDGVKYGLQLNNETLTAALLSAEPAAEGGTIPHYLTLPSQAEVDGKTYTITEVKVNALKGKDLQGVTIPATYTKFAQFLGSNPDLEFVYILGPEVLSEVTNIMAFVGCNSSILYVPEGFDISELPQSIRFYFSSVKNGEPVLPFVVEGIIYGLISDGKVGVKGCIESMTEVVIPATVSDGTTMYTVKCVNGMAFSGHPNIERIDASNVELKGVEWFTNCPKLKEVTVKVTKYQPVEATAFNNSPMIEAVNVVSADPMIRSIDGVVFENNVLKYYPSGKKDATYTIPKDTPNGQEINRIEHFAFYRNPYITTLTVPSTVKTTDSEALFGLKNLKQINLKCRNTYGLNYNSLHYAISFDDGETPTQVTVSVPKGCVEEYKSNISYYSVSIPEWITVNEGDWIAPFTGVAQGYFVYDQIDTDKVRLIGKTDELTGSFDGRLEVPAKVTIDDVEYTVTEIGSLALCNLLISDLILPETITRLGEAIINSTVPTTVQLKGNVPALTYAPFSGEIACVQVPSAYYEAYAADEYFGKFVLAVIDEGLPPVSEFNLEIDGIRWSFCVIRKGEVAVTGCDCWLSVEPVTEATVPAIASYKDDTQTYTFAVTQINQSAFWDTPLQSLTVPASVKRICTLAFIGNEYLQTVTLECKASTVLEESIFVNNSQIEKVYVTSEEPLKAQGQALCDNELTTLKLIVPTAKSIEAYRDYTCQEDEWSPVYQPWANSFGVIGLEQDFTTTGLTLADGEGYYNVIPQEIPSFTYEREFAEGVWTSVVLPVSLSYSDWCETYDMAEIYDVNVHDNNRDGHVDDIEIEGLFMREDAVTQAGVPYFIRRKVGAEHKPLSAENVQLEPAQLFCLDGSNTKMQFWIYGTYTGVTGQKMVDMSYYAMAGGAWCLAADETVDLKPMRAYMELRDRMTWEPICVTSGLNRVRVRIEDINEDEAISTVKADDEMGGDGQVVISSRMIGLRAGRYQIGGRNVKVEN